MDLFKKYCMWTTAAQKTSVGGNIIIIVSHCEKFCGFPVILQTQ